MQTLEKACRILRIAQEIPPATSGEYEEAVLDRIYTIGDLCDGLNDIAATAKKEPSSDEKGSDAIALATDVSEGVMSLIDRSLQQYGLPMVASQEEIA